MTHLRPGGLPDCHDPWAGPDEEDAEFQPGAPGFDGAEAWNAMPREQRQGAEVVPRYEDNEIVAWDVWSDREEIRPGVWTGDFHDTFDNETDAIDLVGSLNAERRTA